MSLRPRVRRVVLFEFYNTTLDLDGCSILDVTPEIVVSEVAAAIEGTEHIGVWIDLLDNVIGEIQQGRRHGELVFQLLKRRLTEMKRQVDEVEREPAQTKMVNEDMTSLSVSNYKLHILKRPLA